MVTIEPFIITGRVTNLYNGPPVKDATITAVINGNETRETKTDYMGVYAMYLPPYNSSRGEYLITMAAQKEKFISDPHSISVTKSGADYMLYNDGGELIQDFVMVPKSDVDPEAIKIINELLIEEHIVPLDSR